MAKAAVMLTGATFLIISTFFVARQTYGWVAHHPSLSLQSSSEDGSPQIYITGNRYVPAESIYSVFHEDVGKGLIAIPIEKRRKEICAIDWVRNATIRRLWPNALSVKITERTPVAYVEIKMAGRNVVALVDAEGVFMRVPPDFTDDFPVIHGLSEQQQPSDRRLRVHKYLQLMSELGEWSQYVSEVDLANPENLKVSMTLHGEPYTLMLGEQDFGEKVLTFLKHFESIRAQQPEARLFDLRLPNWITAAPVR